MIISIIVIIIIIRSNDSCIILIIMMMIIAQIIDKRLYKTILFVAHCTAVLCCSTVFAVLLFWKMETAPALLEAFPAGKHVVVA